jgi:hypothetical protein
VKVYLGLAVLFVVFGGFIAFMAVFTWYGIRVIWQMAREFSGWPRQRTPRGKLSDDTWQRIVSAAKKRQSKQR